MGRSRSQYRECLKHFCNRKKKAVNANMHWMTLFRLFLQVCRLSFCDFLRQKSTPRDQKLRQWGGFQHFRDSFQTYGQEMNAFVRYRPKNSFSYKTLRHHFPQMSTVRLFDCFLDHMGSPSVGCKKLAAFYKITCREENCGDCENWGKLNISLKQKIREALDFHEEIPDGESTAESFFLRKEVDTDFFIATPMDCGTVQGTENYQFEAICASTAEGSDMRGDALPEERHEVNLISGSE